VEEASTRMHVHNVNGNPHKISLEDSLTKCVLEMASLRLVSMVGGTVHPSIGIYRGVVGTACYSRCGRPNGLKCYRPPKVVCTDRIGADAIGIDRATDR
jgi:hypothetical protein